MSESRSLTIYGQAIRREHVGDRARELMCITDLWRAGGAPKDRRPADYIRKAEFRRLAKAVASHFDAEAAAGGFRGESVEVLNQHCKTTRQKGRGRGGGDTWVHWQLGLGYAMWISPEFHVHVQDVYRAFLDGLLVPSGDSVGAPTVLAVDVSQLPRIGGNPTLRDDVQAWAAGAAAAGGFTIARLYGWIRKTFRVASPFDVSEWQWPTLRELLKDVVTGRIVLFPPSDGRLNADPRQRRLFPWTPGVVREPMAAREPKAVSP